MAGPVYNPQIPFLGMIPGGFMPGRMVRVQGNVPYNANRFAINLQCGPNTDPRDDIALHLNVRFAERCAVRNHLQNYSWGPEETAGGLPLQPGAPFEVLLLCEAGCIKVAFNGQHFCEFVHRLPYDRISHLTIDGEVNVNVISWEGAPVSQPTYGAPSYAAPPPAYSQPGYAQPVYAQPAYGQPVQPVYGQPQPVYAQPGYAQAPVTRQQGGGLGTGAAVGLGVGALAAGGLAGYALGGGFSDHDDHVTENVTVIDDAGDFGGDDWMD